MCRDNDDDFGWLTAKLAGRQQGPRLPSAQAIIFEWNEKIKQ